MPGADLDEAVEKALLAAGRALALDPDLIEPRSVLAINAQRQGDWIGSRQIFEAAHERDPDNPTISLWLAEHYRYLGMIELSKPLLATARKAEPNSPPILTEMAMNLYFQGQLGEGARVTDRLWFDLGHQTPSVWATRWFIAMEQGEFGAARVWVGEAPFEADRSVLLAFVDRMETGEAPDQAALARPIQKAIQEWLPPWAAYHMLDLAGLSDSALQTLDDEARDGMFEESFILSFARGSTLWNRQGRA